MPDNVTSSPAALSSTPARHEGSPCPRCGALKAHHTHRKGNTEYLLAFLGGRIRRCHACNLRFARLFDSVVYIEDARRVVRAAALSLLMLVGAALFTLLLLWLMKGQTAPTAPECRLESPAVSSSFAA